MTGKEWLALNDPEYVAPQTKGATNKQIPLNIAELGEMLGAQVVRKVNGRYTQGGNFGFNGEGEGLVAICEANQDHKAELRLHHHRRGGRKTKHANRYARRAGRK